jgi:hypothetical protein
MLACAQERPEKKLSMAAIKRAFALLAQDARRIDDAAKDVERARWPDDFSDKGAKQHIEKIQRARLAMFDAVVLLSIAVQQDAGCDVEALRKLGRALGSALTGSGVEYRNLLPPAIHTNTPEPHEQDLRARLVSLAELAEGAQGRLRRLYDAAEKAGMDRRKARRMVANARAGKLGTPTFEHLRAYWKAKLAPLVASGRDVAELLDPYRS